MEDCVRMGCDKVAVALLTFSPQEAKAWLYDLTNPDPTGGMMLCRRHANATVVPMSWQLVDARDPAWPGPPLDTDPVLIERQMQQIETPSAAPAPEPALVPEPVLVGAHLPSDNAVLDEFGALTADLPVVARPYTQPTMADAAVGSIRPADPSLFELPLADLPAVSPHPGY